MGIQLIVEAEELIQRGWVEVVEPRYIHDEEVDYDVSISWWTAPDGVRMHSDVPGCLIFDNKNVYQDRRDYLDAQGIPYSRG